MYLVNHYLKRWNEDEIMNVNVVSVLRNTNSIDLAITDTVIEKRIIKCQCTVTLVYQWDPLVHE